MEETVLSAFDVLEQGCRSVVLVDDAGDGCGIQDGVDLLCHSNEVTIALERFTKLRNSMSKPTRVEYMRRGDSGSFGPGHNSRGRWST